MFDMIKEFLNTSRTLLNTYADGMYPIDSSKVYKNILSEYLVTLKEDRIAVWQKSWPQVFDNWTAFTVYILTDPKISFVQKAIVILKYLKRFPKVKYLWDIYKNVFVTIIMSPSLAYEVKREVKYNNQLLLEFLQDWDLKEQPENYKEIIDIIRQSRMKYFW